MANTLRHTGIVVTDIEKHISLWTAIMGFSVISDNLESGSQIESILGIPDVKVRTVKLIDDLKQTIELLYFENPKSPTKDKIGTNSLGITHVAVKTDSMTKLKDSLIDFGFHCVNDPVVSPNGSVKVGYFALDGSFFLEIVEVL
jgi:hypothetical protein